MAQGTPTRPPPRPGLSTSSKVSIFLLLLTFMVMIDPSLSNALGMGASAILGPLFGFGGRYPVVTLFFAATLTTGVSTIIRHIFTDWVKMAKTQKQTSALSKATMEALRRGNTAKVEKLREQTNKMRADNLGMTGSMMKYMAFTFLMFILVYFWLNNFVNTTAMGQGTTLFAVPWSFQTSMTASYVFASWLLLYMLFNIFLGQLFARLLKFLSFRKKLAAMSPAAEAG